MQCRIHPTRAAANTCNHCGNWLCDECAVDLQGRLFCRTCLASLAQGPTQAHDAHAPVAEPPAYYHKYRNKISGGVLFLFSILPGANYMYMGLIKRGLATMCGFFLIIFLISNASWPFVLLLGLSIPVYVITSFFDGFNIRRRINMGEVVDDNIGDALGGILASRFLRTFLLVVVSVVLIFNVLNIAINIISALLPVIIVLLVVYIIFRHRNPRP